MGPSYRGRGCRTSVKLKSSSLNSTETFLPPTSKFKFTRVLDNFQRVNREAEDGIEKGWKLLSRTQRWRSVLGEGQGVMQSKTLTMLKEEEKINQLQDRERFMRQLESDITKFKVGSMFY